MRVIPILMVSILVPAIAAWSIGCDDGGDDGTGGDNGTGGTGGSAGSGGASGDFYLATYSNDFTDCVRAPQLGSDVYINIEGNVIGYSMTVDGERRIATGTWDAVTMTGVGLSGFGGVGGSGPGPGDWQFSFNITFPTSLDQYDGSVVVNYLLDPNVGPSMCFGSADVDGQKAD